MKKLFQANRFTLIELLVVVAIIGILASMLLPSLAQARGTALRTQCMNQMKQIGMQDIIYSEENEGYIVPGVIAGTSWSNWGTRASNGVFQRDLFYCPSNAKKSNDLDVSMNSGFNGRINRLNYFTNPEERVMLTESRWYAPWSQSYYLMRVYDVDRGDYFYWHQEGANTVMFDGHAEYNKQPYLFANRWRIWGS